MVSLPSRARLPKSAMVCSISAERHAVGLAHHRHHQALVGADGDADVVVVLVDDVLPVDLGVDGRNLLQRLDAGLHEEAHEAELHAVALLEQVLVLAPELHDGAHVHVVERGEHGCGVLRVLEAPGDGLAQSRHAHALLARRHRWRPTGARICVDRHGRKRRRGRVGRRPRRVGAGRCRRLGRRGGGDHILFQDLAAPAGAVHVGRGDPLLLHHLAGRGCGRHLARGRSRSWCRPGADRRRRRLRCRRRLALRFRCGQPRRPR